MSTTTFNYDALAAIVEAQLVQSATMEPIHIGVGLVLVCDRSGWEARIVVGIKGTGRCQRFVGLNNTPAGAVSSLIAQLIAAG